MFIGLENSIHSIGYGIMEAVVFIVACAVLAGIRDIPNPLKALMILVAACLCYYLALFS
jgi:hypothetical protein